MPYDDPGYITIERRVWKKLDRAREEQWLTWTEFMENLFKLYEREAYGYSV